MEEKTLVRIADGQLIDLRELDQNELIDAFAATLCIENTELVDALKGDDNLSTWRDADSGGSGRCMVHSNDDLIADNIDLGRAADAAKRRHDPDRQLADVLHYLTRAIPDLDPLIALCERETGRKLTP